MEKSEKKILVFLFLSNPITRLIFMNAILIGTE